MADYICLTCGEFQSGNENRRMYNHCPACEQESSDPTENDNVSLHWELRFHEKGLPPAEKREKIEMLMNRCLQCEKGEIELQKIQLPDVT